MASADLEPRDDAAEYVLGTLDAAERAAFEARLAREPALAAEVARWQEQLAPLGDATAAVEPPAHLFAAILSRIDARNGGNVVQLRRRAAAWRNAAVGAMAIAASLLIFVAIRGTWSSAPAGVYVAVLKDSESKAAFVAMVDEKTRLIAVRRLGAGAPEGHSYELWALGAGRAAPRPLGVIDAVARIPADRLENKPLGATLFAVSLEPEGGSPTGSPTGPVLFTGSLVSAE